MSPSGVPEGRSVNDRDRYRVINALYDGWKASQRGERKPSFDQYYRRITQGDHLEDDKLVGRVNGFHGS